MNILILKRWHKGHLLISLIFIFKVKMRTFNCNDKQIIRTKRTLLIYPFHNQLMGTKQWCQLGQERTFCIAYKLRIILSTRVRSSKPAISIEFNDVDSNNSAGYWERTRVLYMTRLVFIWTSVSVLLPKMMVDKKN